MRRRKFVDDVPNRWNSTFLMLKSCVGYTNAINAFVNSKQNQFYITDSDWEKAFKVMKFLKPFYKATKVSSGVYYPTSNLVLLQLVEIAEQFSSFRDDPFFFQIIYSMEEKFKKYYENMPLIFPLAAVMDPRIKLFGVHCALESLSYTLAFNINITNRQLDTFINDMYNDYFIKYGNNENISSTNSTTTSKGKSSFFSMIDKKRNILGSSSTTSTANPNTTPAELERYYQFDHYSLIPEDEVDKLDILRWWKLNERSYPVLSKMARDLLTVLVSTVASESAFSAGNRVLDEQRSRLKEDILEALICVKDWIFAD